MSSSQDAPKTDSAESLRLRRLAEYRVVGTPPEPDFDRLAELAADLFSVPIALVTFVGQDGVWAKARVGLAAGEPLPVPEFCSEAIRTDHVSVVPDTLADPRYRAAALAAGPSAIRFYAGAPIVGPHGDRFGTVCVMARQPREGWTARRSGHLAQLARLAADRLESRRPVLGSDLALLKTVVENVPAMLVVRDVESDRVVLANGIAEPSREGSEPVPSPGPGVTRTVEEQPHRGADGRLRYVKTVTIGLAGPDGAPKYEVGISEDVTPKRLAEQRLAHLSRHDVLTGLPNRASFSEALQAAMARGQKVAVLCIDLDRFKAVNDTLGHKIGDEVLRIAAQRLRRCLRDTDVLARLGGDEFAVIRPEAAGREPTELFAAELVRTLGEPMSVRGQHVLVGASVGIALSPEHGTDPDLLFGHADMAVYCAKADGGGVAHVFDAAIALRVEVRRTLEHDLRQALRLGQFEVFYQPLVRMADRRICGFEALVRWNHPERGLVPPGDFIPLAEESDLIVDLGAWVLEQACREAATWPGDVKVSVNLSAVQFGRGDIVETVTAALKRSGLPARRLDLEITETVLLRDTEGVLSILRRLKALGPSVSMDDFGTGYSSLNYLRAFPFDKIKIDRSFIADLATSQDCRTIVRAIVKLGASLGIATTGEGVETAEQFDLLRADGCTEAQGYLFSPPCPAPEARALLAAEAPVRAAVRGARFGISPRPSDL